MSSNADNLAFQESASEQDNTVLFQAKRWTYITDSSSNGGVFNGQLQFDLNTLSSQNQWTDLSQAYIQFPVKLTLRANAADSAVAVDAIAAGFKNGFHHFADSVQISIGNSTVQSSQIFTNIDTTFKMLTQWSTAEWEKYGPTLGLALDDYKDKFSTAATSSIDNIAISTLSAAFSGVNIGRTVNPGAVERQRFLNSSTAATSSATAILTGNASTLGKGRVQTIVGAATGAIDVYVQFALATIRLKDVSDFISKAPLMKNTKGFIYVNYNSAATTFTANATGAVQTAAPVSSSLYGRCMPANINGFTATAGVSYTFTAEVSGQRSATLDTAAPVFNSARLYAPYYVANPVIDRSLSMKKKIRYNERFVTSFSIKPKDNYSGTISPGITNPKRVILYPYLTGTNSSTAGLTSMSSDPLLSPWDTAPATTSPFAALHNLQLTVGGVQQWQSPVSMDYEAFVQECAQQGLDGSLNSETTQSGVLNQSLWNTLYRYYTCDVSRRMGSDDGASKSVQISCSNATESPMRVIAVVWYEREVVVDTALGMIEQSL
jgi:uncharacterized MAPEG superfamily protein